VIEADFVIPIHSLWVLLIKMFQKSDMMSLNGNTEQILVTFSRVNMDIQKTDIIIPFFQNGR